MYVCENWFLSVYVCVYQSVCVCVFSLLAVMGQLHGKQIPVRVYFFVFYRDPRSEVLYLKYLFALPPLQEFTGLFFSAKNEMVLDLRTPITSKPV